MTLNLELVTVKNNSLLPRSGHKIVADEKYIYLIGGYVERNTLVKPHEVKGEIWRYNIVFKNWEKCSFDQELFTLGASHSAQRIGDCVFITGGTGLPFGKNILDYLIVINLKKMTQQKFPFIPKKELNRNLPIGTYGHTMTCVYIDKTPFLFIIGGTTGETYHREVYQINLITLESELVSDSQAKNAPEPRYKHEAFLYDDHIYVLGGATGTEFCYSLDIIHKFNVRTRAWSILKAIVPIHISIRCPSMSQNGRYIYVSGGYPTNEYISQAIYQLDLVELSWSLLGTWSNPSYFHDSVFVPHLGAVFMFGGVHRLLPSQKRNNNLYVFQPPTGIAARTLTDMAWETVLRSHNEALERLAIESSSVGDGPVREYLANLGVPWSLIARAMISDAGDVHAA